jgi:hypothetical protein
VVLVAQNVIFRLQRKQFWVFAHPPAKMLAVPRAAGRQTLTHRGPIWQVVGFER